MMNEMGWEDDDDLSLEDDDDDDEEDSPVQTHVESTGEGGIPLGQGLLMGRLSRFIEAVTQPEPPEQEQPQYQPRQLQPSLFSYLTAPVQTMMQETTLDSSLGLDANEDAGGGGWDDDDVLLEELVDDEPAVQQQSGWEDDVLEFDHDDFVAAQPTPQLVHEQPALENSGWGNDLEGLNEEELEPQRGWGDDVALEGLKDDENEANNGGWNDDRALEELDENIPTEKRPEGLDDIDFPTNPPATNDVIRLDVGDVLLDDLEDIGVPPGQEQNVSVNNVDHEPTATGWDDTDALEGMDDMNVPSEQLAPEGSGWADDSLDLDDENEVMSTVPQTDTDVVASGWDDDDNLHDLEHDEDDNFHRDIPSPPARENARKVVVDHVPIPISQKWSESMMTAADESTVLRENAGDDEDDDEPSDGGDFGLVVDHLPSAHPSEQHSAQTSSSIVPSLEEPWTATLPATADPFAVVDHVPDNIADVLHHGDAGVGDETNISVEGDGSSFTQADGQGDEVPERDFGPVVDYMPSIPQVVHSESTVSTVVPSSVSQELEDGSKLDAIFVQESDTNAVVDHVPTEIQDAQLSESGESSASVDGDDMTDMQGDDEIGEVNFGPVVDHMPLRRSTHSIQTVSTIVGSPVNDELGGEDAEAEQNAVEAGDDGGVSPMQPSVTVVDHVPEDTSKSDRFSLAVTSQMSVASELSNTLGDEALESDVEQKEENYGPVVDHTPPPQPHFVRSSTSVKVQAPIEEIEDEEDLQDERQYGPVVDHTPALQPRGTSSVAGSLAVFASPSEVVDDSDDDSDARTGTVDDPSLVSASKNGPTLVDHVPARPDVRPTDASTLVLVDPSEVSTVGDMTYEEQQYGPVVDHTPPARLARVASAAGSTVVAAATSVADQDDTVADDSDDDADGEARREASESEGDADDETLPTLDTRAQPPMETNVVDHVPEPGPRTFGVGSEVTTAPTQSVRSPDETRDSDFGLVVDHLPLLVPPAPPSRSSMAVFASSVQDEDAESTTVVEEETVTPGGQPASEQPTEEAKVVVDHLPPARESTNMHPADSTMTVRSQLSEDETLEGFVRPDRFLPVVDQLPTAGAQFPLSLGGSTTAALATLSEVNDDTILDDAQGWDYDDQELDSIQEHDENGRQSRGSKGLSVTFSETVGDAHGAAARDTLLAETASPGGTQYFDAEIGETLNVSLNETQYFDPELGEMDGVDDEISLRKSPAVRSDVNRVGPSEDEKKEAPPTDGNGVRCSACVEATTVQCPCIQSILDANTTDDAMVITVMTPEGVPIDVDFRKLLRNETMKRLLLEKELETCHSTIESLETIVSQRDASIANDESAMKHVQEAARTATEERDSVRDECQALRRDNEELNAELIMLRDEVSELARAQDEVVERESALWDEVDELRRSHEASSAEAKRVTLKKEEIASKLKQMNDASEEMLSELSKCQHERDTLKAEKEKLLMEEIAKETVLAELRTERSDWSSRKSALEDEIVQLRHALAETSSAISSESELRDQLSSLQIEAATKSGECEELRTQMEQIQKKLQESEGRHFAQIKEALHVQRLHEGEASEYREKIKSLEKSRDNSIAELVASNEILNNGISIMQSELDSVKAENESWRRTMDDTKRDHEAQLRQQQMSFREKLGSKRAFEAKMKILETEKVKLLQEVVAMRSQLNESSSKANEATALKEENHSLQKTLSVNKETIQSLQGQVNALSQASKQGTDQMEALVETLTQECDTLRGALQSSQEQINALSADLRESVGERIRLQDQLENLATKCGELEGNVANLQSNAVQLEFEIAEKERECESLREAQLARDADRDSPSDVREEYEERISVLERRVAEREMSLQALQTRLQIREKRITECDAAIARLEQERSDARKHAEINSRESDDAREQCKQLNAELCRIREQHQSLVSSEIQHERRELELQQRLDATMNERDSLLKEREILEDDMEELLIQLGLNKEQLDTHNAEVEALRKTISEKEFAAKHAEDRLWDAEAYIGDLSRTTEELHNRPQENGVHQAGNIAALEQTIDELAVAKEDLQQQVDDLSSANAYIDAQVTSLRDEKIELLDRLRELEQLQLADSNAPPVPEDGQSIIYHLNTKLHHAERSAQQYQERLLEVEATLEQTQRELITKSEKLSEAEATLFDKELEFDVDEQNREAQNELQGRLREMESLLHQRDQQVRDLMSIQGDMEQEMGALQTELAARQAQQSGAVANGPAPLAVGNGGPLQDMWAKVEALQEQLQSSNAEHRAEEQSLRQEVVILKDTIARKKEQIENREQQLQTLSIELSSCQEQLVTKEADYRRLSLELEEARAETLVETRNITSHLLEGASSREAAESSDTMRAHIISLARALEQSESKRADAIERLLKEREANHDSLRRLGESVKRFYSTLSCGDI